MVRRRLLLALCGLALSLGPAGPAAEAAGRNEAPRDLAFWPGDVSGPSEGVLAVPVDPAAAGFLHGLEASVRRSGATSPNRLGGRLGAWEIHAAVPLRGLALHGGFVWAPVPRVRARAGSLGLSVRVAEALRLGASWQRLRPPFAQTSHSVFDLGLAWRPHAAVAMSIGGEALNAPSWNREGWVARRALRLGLGLRPLAGSSWLTLGVDARLAARAGARQPELRASLDFSPWARGLHVLAFWQRGPAHQALWAGLRIETMGVGAMAAARVRGAASGDAEADRLAALARWQQRPDASAWVPLPRRLEVRLDGSLRPTPTGPFGRAPAVATVAAQLAQLAHDAPHVTEVVLDIGTLDVGLASIDELRRSVAALRAANKRVVARMLHGDNKAYLVAAAADAIELDPGGSLDLTGFVRRRHYYADALAQIGVRFEAVGIGRYKTGPDDLTRARPRPEEGEVQQALVDAAYQTLRQGLRQGRGLSDAQLDAALARGLLAAPEAFALGLVDALRPAVQPSLGQTERRQHGAPLQAASLPSPRWGAAPKVAVVPVTGVMHDGEALLGAARATSLTVGATCDAHAVAARLASAQQDPRVVGIVLRIDSPGGDVFAAERVWRAVREAARHKPIVASLGDVAASGGYYAAVGAPYIFAQRNTITGSIGIYRLKPDFSGLLQRLQVHRAGRAQGEHAGWDDLEAPWGEGDRRRLCTHLQHYYDAFVARVATGRRLTPARSEALAQGRVYPGSEAVTLGLADAEGGLAEAIAWVRQQADVAPAAHVALEVPAQPIDLQGLLGHFSAAATAEGGALPRAWQNFAGLAVRDMQQLARTPWALLEPVALP